MSQRNSIEFKITVTKIVTKALKLVKIKKQLLDLQAVAKIQCRPTGIRTPTNRTKIWCATVTPWVFLFQWCKGRKIFFIPKKYITFFNVLNIKY